MQVILYLFLICIVFVLISSKADIFGVRSYVVLTGSMESAIPAGSIIVVQKQGSYHNGDIITFKHELVEVTHRIVSVKKTNNSITYETKGDSNQSSDPSFVNASVIFGRVRFHIPYIGKSVLFLKTLPGLILFIIIPGILFILIELHAIKTELGKKHEN